MNLLVKTFKESAKEYIGMRKVDEDRQELLDNPDDNYDPQMKLTESRISIQSTNFDFYKICPNPIVYRRRKGIGGIQKERSRTRRDCSKDCSGFR